MLQRFFTWFIPDPVERAKRLLKTAENDKLDFDSALENAEVHAAILDKRIARLRKATQAPAETTSGKEVPFEPIELGG